jgi:protein FrlC
MLNISVMNYNYQRYPFEYFLDSMVRLGVDTIELWAAEPHLYVEDLSEAQLKHICNEIKQRNLKTVCFTPEQCVYPVNIAAKDDHFRRRSIEYFKKSLRIAVELEAPMLLVVPGSGYYNEAKEEGFKRSCESLQILGEEAGKAGITIIMETRSPYGTNLVNTITDLKQLIADVNSPFVKPMLDTVPMYMAGEDVDLYVNEFGDDLKHIHFCDGDGKGSSNMAVGDGIFPMDTYLKSLERYQGYLTLELVVNRYYLEPEKEVRKCLERIHQLKEGM